MMLQEVFVSTAAVRAFIRDALKCGCPDSVFDDVRVGLPTLYDTHGVEGGLEILVGRRLLVAVVPFGRVRNPDTDIPLMLEKGRSVRDEKGFNRYRLVLVGVTDTMRREKLQAMSATLDERLHLHLLDEADLRMGSDEA
jgi:hypothetical protein